MLEADFGPDYTLQVIHMQPVNLNALDCVMLFHNKMFLWHLLAIYAIPLEVGFSWIFKQPWVEELCPSRLPASNCYYKIVMNHVQASTSACSIFSFQFFVLEKVMKTTREILLLNAHIKKFSNLLEWTSSIPIDFNLPSGWSSRASPNKTYLSLAGPVTLDDYHSHKSIVSLNIFYKTNVY